MKIEPAGVASNH